MAWIESHQSLGTHIKLRRLARALDVHRAQAVGHLHYLWWWTLDSAPSGDLSTLSPVELAEAAEWPGDADLFASALQQCGWLDPNGHVHDWGDYAGRLLSLREGNRKRQRRHRKATRNGDVTRDMGVTSRVTSRESNGAVQRDVTGLPNQTKPNQTKPNSTLPNQCVCLLPSTPHRRAHTPIQAGQF